MYTTPVIMLFPELNEDLKGVVIMNEFAWVLDIIRRLLFNA